MVAHISGPICAGVIATSLAPGKKLRPYFKNNNSKKG
jgi:hypothetical protein